MDFKETLAQKAENTAPVKITKEMNIAEMIRVMEPEIKKALPSVITPERFTRMALSALNTNKQLLPEELIGKLNLLTGEVVNEVVELGQFDVLLLK